MTIRARVLHPLGVCVLSAAACTTVIGLPDLPSPPSDGQGASGAQVAGSNAADAGSAAGGKGSLGGSSSNAAGTDPQGAGVGAGGKSSAGGTDTTVGATGGDGAGATDGGAPSTCSSPCTGGSTCQDGECTCPMGEMLCGGTCTPVLSDAENCGGCKQICDGTCNRGRCVTLSNLKVTTSVGNIDHARDLAFSGNTIFFTTFTGDYVCSANRDGTDIKVLASRQVNAHAVAVDANNIYWLNTGTIAQNGSVMKLSRQGGEPVELVSDEPDPYLLALDANYVYWSDAVGPIQKVPLAGGNKSTVSTLASAQQIRSLILDGSTLYWASAADGGSLASGSTSGANVTQLATNVTGQSNYEWLIKGGSYLYLLRLKSGNQYELARTPLDRYQPTPVIDVVSGLYLAADRAAVYVGGNAGVLRIGIDDSSVTQLIDGTAYNLFVDGDDLFFSGNDTVVRVVSTAP